MALNSSTTEIVASRRNKVAALRLRGLSQHAIWEALKADPSQGGMRNPKTGEPFSIGTINGDIQALEAEWRATASIATSDHMARELAEIQAIKVMAFTQKNPTLALRAIELEMKLLGTSAPQKIDLGLPVDKMLAFLDAVRKLGHEPEQFVDRTISRAQQYQQ